MCKFRVVVVEHDYPGEYIAFWYQEHVKEWVKPKREHDEYLLHHLDQSPGH